MPVYQYEDKHYSLPDGLTPEQAKAKIMSHLGKASGPSLGEQLSTGVAQSFASVGNAVDTAGSMLAGAAVSPFSTDTADSIYSSMNEREKSRNQWANPTGMDVGAAGKVAGAVATLPMQLATFPLSSFTAGKTASDAGESQQKVANAIGLDVAGNIAGSLIGPGKTIYASIAKQAGANAAQDYVTKWITQQLMSTKEGKAAFNPTLVDAMVSGIVGGGMGAVTHQAPAPTSPRPKIAGIEAALEAAKPKPEVAATQEAPLVDTRTGQQKSREALEAAIREKELAQQSAFNRPDSLPDLTQRQSPMERMASELGAPELNTEGFGSRSGIGDMANRLLTGERQTTDALSPAESKMKALDDAQAAVNQRQKDLEAQAAKWRENNPVPTPDMLAQIKAIQDGIAAEKAKIEEARIALDSERMAGAQQPEMFEGLDHGYGPNPYDVGGQQHWTVDENGMPIRADLSMEAQNLENPLQRNLWGDELPQKNEQENDLGITQALDTLVSQPWHGDARDAAIERLAPLGSKARAAQVAAKKPLGMRMRKQGGYINPDLLGAGKVVEALRKIHKSLTNKPLSETMKLFKGTFTESSLVSAFNQSVDPKAREHVVLMSPKEFRSLAMTRGEKHWTNKDSTERRSNIKEGLNTEEGLRDVPWLQIDENGKVTGHEGRHRADMLDANRLEAYPVLIKHPSTLNKDFNIKTITGQDLTLNGHPIAAGKNYTTHTFREDLTKAGAGDQWINADKNGVKTFPKDVEVGEAPKVEAAFLRLKDATRRPNPYEDPHGTTAYRQALTKARNAFDKAVEEAGLNHLETYNRLSELHGSPDQMIPFNYKKQGGGLLIGNKSKDAVETLKKGPLGDLLPELQTVADTPSGVIAKLNGLKDVGNNYLQQGARVFTKGFLYEKFKTNHPLIRYAYDRLSDAIDAGTRTNHKMLQQDLLPKLRSLDNEEMTDLHGAMLASMKSKVALSSDMLRQNGFNEKQIATWESFQTAYKQSLDAINQARLDNGMKPLDPYVGYMAGQATGDFRSAITVKGKDGTPVVVGIVGANTKAGLNYRVKKVLESNPEYSAEKSKFYGDVGGRKRDNALAEALTLLSDKDPNVLAFIDEYSKVMQNEAYDYHGAKKHTLEKKGVFGMEGDKPWKDAYTNAFEGFEAQVRYIETMSKWAELSKATKDLKEVFSDPAVQEAHPNAVAMSKEYLSNALGFDTSKLGKDITSMVAAVGEGTGLGTHYFNRAIQGVRGGINTIFFALKPAFLLANHLQAFIKTPTMVNYLRARGLDVGNFTTTGHAEFMAAGLDGINHLIGRETPFSKEMWKYGNEHGISATQIFEHSTDIRRGFSHYKNAILETGLGTAESVPRSMMYAMMSNILRKNGFEGHPDIFKMARELTNVAMADYRPHEAQRANRMTGPFAPLLGNLSTYAANENSTIALLARDSVKNKTPSPIIAAVLTGLLAHGIMGFPGFAEADYLYENLSKWIGGKPRTLADTILTQAGPNGKLGDALSLGMPAAAGIDLHNILGRSSMLPAIFGGGGAGAAVDIAQQGIETIKDPSEMNAKRMAHLINPVGALKGPLEMKWFSRETPQGSLALDRRVGHGGEGTFMRNEFDVAARKAGVTSTREFKSKEQLRQQRNEDAFYSDKQKTIIARYFDKREKSNYSKEDLQASLDAYIEHNGDPKTFVAEMVKHGINMNTSAVQRYLMQKAQSGNVKDILALKRFKERTYLEEAQ